MGLEDMIRGGLRELEITVLFDSGVNAGRFMLCSFDRKSECETRSDVQRSTSRLNLIADRRFDLRRLSRRISPESSQIGDWKETTDSLGTMHKTVEQGKKHRLPLLFPIFPWTCTNFPPPLSLSLFYSNTTTTTYYNKPQRSLPGTPTTTTSTSTTAVVRTTRTRIPC